MKKIFISTLLFLSPIGFGQVLSDGNILLMYHHSALSNSIINPTSILLSNQTSQEYPKYAVQLTATILPANTTNKTVTWTSSNTSIATVSNGLISAKSVGTCNIIASTINGKKDTCVFTVKSYPTIATDFFARMSVTPNDTLKGQLSKLIDSLDYYNIWDSADVYRVFALQDTADATLNLISTNFKATRKNTPTFTAYTGFTGNGSSMYINSNYNPSSNATHYRLNSASIHVYTNSNTIVDAKALTGVTDGTNVNLFSYRTAGYFQLRLNSALASILTYQHRNNIGGGLTLTRNSSSQTCVLQNDGVYLHSGTNNSTALPNGKIFTLCYNSSGSALGYSNDQLSFFYVGGQLTELQAQKLYEAEQRYLDFYNTGKAITYSEISVKSAGGGDYTKISSALAAITDNTYYKRYNLNIVGTFNEKNLQMKDYVNLIGQDTTNSRIIGYLPADTAEAAIQAIATVNNGNIICDIRNLYISIQNGRYAIHNDGGAANNSIPVEQNIINCKLVHKGNAEADAHYGHTVWTTPDAHGFGCTGNTHLTIDSCTIETYGSVASTSRACGFHSNTAATNTSVIWVKNSSLITHQTYALRVGFMYANQDHFNFQNVKLYNGGILIDGTAGYTDNTTTSGTNPIILNGSLISD